MINNVTLVGRMTKDPQLKYTGANGDFAIANITLAVPKVDSKDKQEELKRLNKPTADFIKCKALGKAAELIGNYTKKGDQLGIEGKIVTYQWQDENNKNNQITEVEIRNITFMGGAPQNKRPQAVEVEETKDEAFFPVTDGDIPF